VATTQTTVAEFGFIWQNLAAPLQDCIIDAKKTGSISTCPDLNLIEAKNDQKMPKFAKVCHVTF
jgi:hypothetical protein